MIPLHLHYAKIGLGLICIAFNTPLARRFGGVTEATRIRQHQTPSTLDDMFMDDENVIEFITYETPLANSDHVVLRWNLLLALQDIKSTQVKHNYHKGNFADMQVSIQSVNWDDHWIGKTVNEMWT